MARKATPHPTEAEFEILSALWDHGPSTLGDVWNTVRRNRPVARTTIATTLNTMLNKGLVRRSEGPQAYLWSASRSRDRTVRDVVGHLLDRVFDGSARRLMTHLIDGGRLSEQDAEAVRRMLADYGKSSESESKQ